MKFTIYSSVKKDLLACDKFKNKNRCRDPGLFKGVTNLPDLNQGPSDLQSDALPTELSRQVRFKKGNEPNLICHILSFY